MLPLRTQTRCPERRGGQFEDKADGQPPQLGLWPVLPLSPQRQELQMKSQASLPRRQGAGAQFADQASQAAGERETRGDDGAT